MNAFDIVKRVLVVALLLGVVAGFATASYGKSYEPTSLMMGPPAASGS